MNSINALFQVANGAINTDSLLTTILPLVLMAGIFYFGLIRPQKKKEKEVSAMRENLSVGDEVLTIGGICGKIIQVKKDIVVIETTGMHTRLELMKWGIHSISKEKGKKDTAIKDEIVEDQD